MSSITFPPNSDDYIGTESCTDLQNIDHVIDNHQSFKSNDAGNKTKVKNNIKMKENKVFPPPIPLLARTQNLASHMPWVLKRYYTNEGRLILKEEKVKHHEYFRAHSANGRLTLQLVNVPFDDHDEYFEEATPSPHEAADIIDNVTHDNDITSNGRFDEDEENEARHSGSGRVKKYLNSSNVRSGPACNIFGVPGHPIRTVRG
ncbi:hypothetical protein JHK82_040267 [Glycine max]|nr:hypothetical protein JHK82_040267 [Glycine max]